MLVVTFSNAAAAEMKEKILRSISQEMRTLLQEAEEPEAPVTLRREKRKKAEFLRTQLRKAHSADISTFHKFSMNIIRRYFYLTDTEADFSVCDESRRQLMQAEALDEMLEERFASGGEEFSEFLRNYSGVRSEEKVREMILDVYRFIMSMPDPFGWLKEACAALGAGKEEFRKSAVWKYISEKMKGAVEEAADLAEQVCEMTEHLPSLLTKAEKDMEKINNILESMEENFSPEDVFRQVESVKFERFSASKEEKEEYAEIKDIVSGVRNRMKKNLADIREKFFPIPEDEMLERMNAVRRPAEYLYGLVEEFHRRFSEKKKEKNLVDFSDIEHIALRILEHEEAAEGYRKHFRVIFVDEYQDSSVLRETLIRRISRGDNVYMVGDVKQSIYKFRLAEPEIFIGKYNSFEQDPARAGGPDKKGRRIDLNRNFRCKGNIVRCVNGIFSNVMDRAHGGIDYDENAALKKGVAYEGPLDREVTLHLVDSAGAEDLPEEGIIDEEIAELKKAELEAVIVAKLAAERIGQDIYDSKKEKVRKTEPSDIAILLRSTKGAADIYAEALKREGIASYIDAGEGYFETMEIEVFMNLLRVIDNRRRDIPLISVLRSPVFGLTVSELIGIRLAHPSGSYSEAFLASEHPKCRAAREKLDAWRLKSGYMPLEEFLWTLMRESGYFEYASALPGGDRRAANLSALADKAVAYSASQNSGLFGFVRYVEALSRNRVATGQSSKHSGAENSVRIMTIHKSKGLEFPVVIAGGLGRGFDHSRKKKSVILHRELGLGLNFADAGRNCSSRTIVQNAIEMKKKDENLAEEMRILYVAMTRAMDELVLTGSLKNIEKELENVRLGLRGSGNPRCFLDWILPNLEAAGIRPVCHDRLTLSEDMQKREDDAERLREKMNDGFSGEAENADLFRVISERFSFRYPYGEDVFSKSKFSVSELNRMIRGQQAVMPEAVFSAIPDSPANDRETENEIQLSIFDLTELPGYGGQRDISAALDEKIRQIQLKEKRGDEEPEIIFADAARRRENEFSQAAPLSGESCEAAVPAFLRGETPITAAMRGTIMHRVMELIPFREDISEKDVEDFTASLVEKNILNEREAGAVSVRDIAGFFRTETGKRACRADWLKREWPFTLKKKREELAAAAEDRETADRLRSELPQELLIQGIIDCCFGDEKGIVIIDYKTDYIDFREKEESYREIRSRYRNQIAMYRDVVRKAFDTENIETKIFLLRSGEVIGL